MRELDGGGHAQAASARSALDPDVLEARLLRRWHCCDTVADRMSRNVRGLEVTLNARLPFNWPVRAERVPRSSRMEAWWAASRRDLERALRHGLGHRTSLQ